SAEGAEGRDPSRRQRSGQDAAGNALPGNDRARPLEERRGRAARGRLRLAERRGGRSPRPFRRRDRDAEGRQAERQSRGSHRGAARRRSGVDREEERRKGEVVRRLVLALFLMSACHRAADVPVYTVVPSHFARRVTAEGNLKAKNSATVNAPQDAAEGPLKVAWIADDGTLLQKGDLVARFDATDFALLLRTGNEDLATAGNKRTKTDVDASTTTVNLKRDAKQADAELLSARMFRFDDAEVFSRYQRIESQVDEQLASEK